MAENTISAIVPDVYEALDVVSRELTGMIPSVTLSASAERVGINQNVVVDVEPAGNVADITPAMYAPDPTGQTSSGVSVVITKSRAGNFGFIGDDQKKLNTGPGYMNTRAGKIAQALRAVVNEVETDLCALHQYFSRAAGTAGTTPFGTAGDFTAATLGRAILSENGAPLGDVSVVMNSLATANMLGKQSQAYAQGTDSMLRQGVLLDHAGMKFRESAQIVNFTKGTGASATTNTAGYAVGATTITLASAGTGTILAGDVITFAGDTNQYVVLTGDSDVSNGGSIVLNAPGLKKTIPASATAITVVASSARNLCFARSSIVLAARMPARPVEGDMASDVMEIIDPRSGLAFELAMYKGYRKVRYEIGLAWGVKIIKPEHAALVLG